MAKTQTQKRKVKKNRPHQHLKSSGPKKNINWGRVTIIAIGIIIALSMLLSLIVTPGTGFQG